jgi:hypothetical protein
VRRRLLLGLLLLVTVAPCAFVGGVLLVGLIGWLMR